MVAIPIRPTVFQDLDATRQSIVLDRVRTLAANLSEQREQILSEIRALDAEVLRRECTALRGFVDAFWHVVEPKQALSWNWHLDELCALLEDVDAGKYSQVVINVPPGTMKSLLISVFYPAWKWSKASSHRFLCGSYGGHLSVRDNLRVRDIVTSPLYRKLFPDFAFSSDQNAKERFNTTAGGWRIATSVGGVGTGEHPDTVIIDDPHSAAQAASDAERATANDWLDRTISTRGITRGVAIIIIMQRLHEQDMTGHVLARGGWEHICFPMRYEVSRKDNPNFRPDPRDRRVEPGELLWPDLFPEAAVRRLEINLGPYGAAGQLQQRPAPEGGGLFKRQWLKLVDAAPATAKRRVRGWDTAATLDGGDYTVGVRIAETAESTYVIEDVVREQLSPAGVEATMRLVAELDGRFKCAQREEREGGASGKTVVVARARLLKGFDYSGIVISADKVTRSMPFRAQCEAGNVCLVRGPWNEAYISELCAFPTGQHDDQVDASSAAFNHLTDTTTRVLRRATWGR